MGRAWGHGYEEALRDQEEDVVILVETIGDRGCRYMGNQSFLFIPLLGQCGVY